MKSLIEKISSFELDSVFSKIYGASAVDFQKNRALSVCKSFNDTFGYDAIHLCSAPGRTEIGGNHTDHQKGTVLAASIDLDALAAVSKNNTQTINIFSEGYSKISVNLDDITPTPSEYGTTKALISGTIGAILKEGFTIDCGFDAYITSNVLGGSGLSSSAAFEVLLVNIVNELYLNKAFSPIKIAKLSQYIENVYFGKPCGLMDQMACSVGGVISIDFKNDAPSVNEIPLDFSKMGVSLCIVDSGVDHADLTDEYSAITTEMASVSKFFGKTYLSEVCEDDFYKNLPALRKEVSGRALLRAIHYFNDTKIALKEAEAIKNEDYPTFLNYIKESGKSSIQCLQNVVPTGQIDCQGLLLSISLCEKLLDGKGAVRVHGGGFAGTAQAFVPLDMVDSFKKQYEEVFGENTCHVLSIRPVGGILLA